MSKIKLKQGIHICLLFLMTAAFSCATIPSLNLNYRLPLEGGILKGKRVFLNIKDQRSDKGIIGRGAMKEFEGFSGNVSFSLARGAEEGFKMGLYEPPALFLEAFKKRLEAAGVQVLASGEEGEAEMVILLKSFSLDKQGRAWKANTECEIRLEKSGTLLSKQIVSGEGERIKIMGRRQADQVISEIFTDTVNRLDLERLFEQAGL